jgi:predicted RNA-binding protein Jag
MKSIMEEASSVAKAIEKGWIRAGKPQEFSVKVFEEAQKNFIGMTTKPAKIALFFEERNTQSSHQKSQPTLRPIQPQQQKRQPQTQQPQRAQQPASKAQQPPRPERSKRDISSESQSQSLQNAPTPWNPDLTDAAQSWVKDSLALLNLGHIPFTVTPDRFALKISFSSPLVDKPEKEKMLFRSWAYLIMQTLRQKYKRPLKGLKIILMSNA